MIAAALLACAVNVHPTKTLEAIIRVESGGNPLAIHVNNYSGPQPHPENVDDAVLLAKAFIARGYRVDLGIMQITDANLPGLGFTVEQAFDPCLNIKGGAAILTEFYSAAIARYAVGEPALEAAISAYDTGTFWRGFRNGYVPASVIGIPAVALRPLSRRLTQHCRPGMPGQVPYAADTVAYTTGSDRMFRSTDPWFPGSDARLRGADEHLTSRGRPGTIARDGAVILAIACFWIVTASAGFCLIIGGSTRRSAGRSAGSFRLSLHAVVRRVAFVVDLAMGSSLPDSKRRDTLRWQSSL